MKRFSKLVVDMAKEHNRRANGGPNTVKSRLVFKFLGLMRKGKLEICNNLEILTIMNKLDHEIIQCSMELERLHRKSTRK